MCRRASTRRSTRGAACLLLPTPCMARCVCVVLHLDMIPCFLHASIVSVSHHLCGVQYNPYRPPMDNIGLPDSLLSRFDLLFILLDKVNTHSLYSPCFLHHSSRTHLVVFVSSSHHHPLQMEPDMDSALAEHVLRTHAFRRPGEADGDPMLIATSAECDAASEHWWQLHTCDC